MQSIDLAQLWTVAVVLVGFEVAALAWRFNRELAMEADDQPTWLTFADLFVGLSVLVVVFGVFAAPLFGTLTTYWAVRLFGLALVFFVSSAVVLAGHYNLYCELGVKYQPDGTRCGRSRVTTQERLAIGAAIILLGGYGALWALT